MEDPIYTYRVISPDKQDHGLWPGRTKEEAWRACVFAEMLGDVSLGIAAALAGRLPEENRIEKWEIEPVTVVIQFTEEFMSFDAKSSVAQYINDQMKRDDKLQLWLPTQRQGLNICCNVPLTPEFKKLLESDKYVSSWHPPTVDGKAAP